MLPCSPPAWRRDDPIALHHPKGQPRRLDKEQQHGLSPDTRLRTLSKQLAQYSQLKHEYGAAGTAPIVARAEEAMKAAIEDLQRLPDDPVMAVREPNELAAVRALRPVGPRSLWEEIDAAAYQDRLTGALLGSFAGRMAEQGQEREESE